MVVGLTSQEIARKYDRFARWYNLVEGIPDLLGIRKLRKRLLRRASGNVLEVAAGTGKNLPYYRDYGGSRTIIAVDVRREMLHRARQRAASLRMNVSFVLADSEALPFSRDPFDTVVSTLTTCTFSNPEASLREMARVCKPEGRILLVEHGRSDREWLGRWQDRQAERHARQVGCHWNREPLRLVNEAGLKVAAARRRFFGIFHEIDATP